MDIAAFKVSHCVGSDIDATTIIIRTPIRPIFRSVRIHVGVGQRCVARDEKAPATPIRRRSGVVMDIAAFKVSHCVGSDIDATTIRPIIVIIDGAVVMDVAAFKVSHSLDIDAAAMVAFATPIRIIPACGVRIHVGVNQRCRARDVDPPTITSSGVVMDITAFKVSHSVDKDATASAIISGVVMDVAAFEVCHSVGIDSDTTAPITRGVVMDIAAFKVSHSVGIDTGATTKKTGVVMDVAAFKVSHSFDKDATAPIDPPPRSSGVVMDIATFKVSHCVGSDIDATTPRSVVVMDIAIFKVSHSVVINIDATASIVRS
jgi:hypothetical protein